MAGVEFVLAVSLILVFYFYNYLKQNRIAKFFQQYPQPPTKPIVGNALDFKNSAAYFNALHEYTNKYGGIVSVKIGPFRRILLVSDYKMIEAVLSSNKLVTKARNYRFLEPWLGTGILNAVGVKWRTHRRMITPAFHFKILEDFVDIFERNADTLVNKLKKIDGTKSVNIFPYITLCTLDIICESAMGVSINAQENEELEYVKCVQQMCKFFINRSYSAIKGNDFLYSFTEDYRKEKYAIGVLHNHTDSVIKKRIEERSKQRKKELVEDEDDLGRKKRRAFLDLLIEATIDGKPLTLEEIREEVDNVMFGGHDTTASGISFILYCMSKYPEVQAKVLEEQHALFGDDPNPKITYENLQEMKYLEMVIKESMRMYPPAIAIGRRTEEDFEYNGTVIPKDVSMLIFIRGVHMNPEFWPEPEKFDPTRFEDGAKRPPYSYIPFSAGPRNCLGQKYAYTEMKAVVSKIIRNFEILPPEPSYKISLTSAIVMSAENGVNVGIRSRTSTKAS